MMLNSKAVRALFSIAMIALIGMVTVGLVIHALTPAIFPDELEFYQIVRAQIADCTNFFCLADNHYGYGSLWWDIFQLVEHSSSSQAPAAIRWTYASLEDPALPAIYDMRLLSVAFLMAAILTAAYFVRRNPARLASVLAILVLPLVWWNGRGAGPDFLGVALAILGTVALLRHRPRLALVFFGIDAAIRLSNACGMAGFAVLALLEIYHTRRNSPRRNQAIALALGLVCGIGGYIVGDPSILAHPLDHITQAKGLTVDKQNLPLKMYLYFLYEMLIDRRIEWDMQTVGSVASFWGGCMLALTTLITGWMSYRRRLVAAILVGISLEMAALLIRKVGYGWYFMPVVAASYIAIAMTVDWRHITGTKRQALVALQIVAMVLAVKNTYYEASLYFSRAATSMAGNDNVTCTLATIENRPATAQLWLNLDPTYTMMPLAQGSTGTDNILPMHETVESVTKENIRPTIGVDYYVTSDYMLRENPHVQAMWRRMASASDIRNCGPFVILMPRAQNPS